MRKLPVPGSLVDVDRGLVTSIRHRLLTDLGPGPYEVTKVIQGEHGHYLRFTVGNEYSFPISFFVLISSPTTSVDWIHEGF